MSRDLALFLHLIGMIAMVGGAVGVGALRVLAISRARPSESAVLLGAARPLVPVVGAGLVLAVGAGFWLAGRSGVALGSGWLVASYVLVGYLAVVGAVAGRRDRRTRELAERVASHGDGPTAELTRRLRDPLALTLNLSMLAAMLAIVALMVWKP